MTVFEGIVLIAVSIGVLYAIQKAKENSAVESGEWKRDILRQMLP